MTTSLLDMLQGNPRGRKCKSMLKPVSICVIGSRYVGLVAAVCFAEMGHQIVCVDNNEAKAKMLREGGVPIFERHLPEMLARHGAALLLRRIWARPSRAARLFLSPWARRRAIRAQPISLTSRR